MLNFEAVFLCSTSYSPLGNNAIPHQGEFSTGQEPMSK